MTEHRIQDQLRNGTFAVGAKVAYKAANYIDELEAKLTIAEKGIQDFLDGDYDYPGNYPKQCSHDRYFYEDCFQCDEAHFISVQQAIGEDDG